MLLHWTRMNLIEAIIISKADDIRQLGEIQEISSMNYSQIDLDTKKIQVLNQSFE